MRGKFSSLLIALFAVCSFAQDGAITRSITPDNYVLGAGTGVLQVSMPTIRHGSFSEEESGI